MQTAILRELTEKGYHVRAVPYARVSEVRDTIEAMKEDGSLTGEVYDEVMEYCSYDLPAELPHPSSVIILADANPPHMNLTFEWKGKTIQACLPGLYRPYLKSREVIWQDVGQALARYGYHWVRAALPLKTLAVRSGLARYGRNNISYIEGLGNFHRLMAFYTDMPCQEDPWVEARMLERCETCNACRSACPTAAIAGDRFLIHAERCITFYNEKDLDVAFPDWFKPAWHTCLAGCLECQKICPENRNALNYVDGEVFNEEETALFLKGVKVEDLPAGTREKAERSGMINCLDVLPRNLQVLLS